MNKVLICNTMKKKLLFSILAVADCSFLSLGAPKSTALVTVRSENSVIKTVAFIGERGEESGKRSVTSGVSTGLESGNAVFEVAALKYKAGFVIRCYNKKGEYIGYYNHPEPMALSAGQNLELDDFDSRYVSLRKAPEVVDMGLPSGIKWASANLGAKNPYEAGDFYAWGEIQTKDFYNRETADKAQAYRFGRIASAFVKYLNQTSMYGSRLQIIDDAVAMNCGGKFRTPTKSDFEELLKYCDWEYVYKYDGHPVSGLVFYKKATAGGQEKSGPRLFFPTYGYMNKDERKMELDGFFMMADYEESEANDKTFIKAGCFRISGKNKEGVFYPFTPYFGMTVRPVCDK